jgi:hypothetical protein
MTSESTSELAVMQLNDITITMRKSDGYVNATQLCQAGKKLFADWKRLKITQKILKAYQDMGIPISFLIKEEHLARHSQKSWVHQDLAINIAQWISPEFSIQVSRWIRELLITGKVELGKEKTSEELDQFSKELETLKIQYHQKISSLELDKNDLKLALEIESQKRKEAEQSATRLLQKRKYHEFQKGPAFYIWHDDSNASVLYKFGITEKDINKRLAQERTTTPALKIDLLVYCSDPRLLESNMKQRYQEQRAWMNHEFIYNVKLDLMKEFIIYLLKCLKMQHTFAEDIEHYNVEIDSLKDTPLIDVHSLITFKTLKIETRNEIENTSALQEGALQECSNIEIISSRKDEMIVSQETESENESNDDDTKTSTTI